MASANKYVAWATTTALGLFGLLRLPWIESHVVLPLTRLQGDVAASAFNTPAAPVSVTLACSGTEVIAMCLGAVLAYPVSWRARLSGAVLIVIGILGLNTLRIGTLGLAADDTQWFNALHLYLWPAALVLATSGAVFVWMRYSDRAPAGAWSPSWRFVGLAFVLLAASALSAPAYINSDVVQRIGTLIAHAGAGTLSALGAPASATGNVLWTTRGGFSVTGDCVATPLLPLYLAAVWIYATTWPWRVVGTVLVVPIFVVLGVVRLLLVALPQAMAPAPEFATHAFYQVVLACVVIGLAGRWRHGPRAWGLPVAGGIAAAVLIVLAAGNMYAPIVLRASEHPLLDPQGALMLLPSFQIALAVALWITAGQRSRWAAMSFGLLLLVASQLAGAWLLTLPGLQELLAQHVSVVRAWAIAAPAVVFALLVHRPALPIYGESVQNSTVSPVVRP